MTDVVETEHEAEVQEIRLEDELRGAMARIVELEKELKESAPPVGAGGGARRPWVSDPARLSAYQKIWLGLEKGV